MTMAVEAVLSIGSNFGDRTEQVSEAMQWISSLLSGSRCSRIYATDDCHGGPRVYHNAVVAGQTDLPASELEELCKRYEYTHGRTPHARAAGDVPIDIDLVIYDAEILRPADFRRSFFRIGYSEVISDAVCRELPSP